MDRMDASREQDWEYRELNTIGSNNYASALPVSINAKFIRIWLLSMSATFYANPGMCGRFIFGHFSTTSTVANSNVIAYPCFISKLIRASNIALRDVSEQRLAVLGSNLQAAVRKFFLLALAAHCSECRFGNFV